MKTQIVTLVGLERITGSIGLALQSGDLGLTIVGHDRDRSLAAEAKKLGIVSQVTNNLATAASGADILIVNVSLSDLEQTLEIAGAEVREHTLVVDLSNMKGVGQKWADKYMVEGHYVGAKPVLAADTLTDGRMGIEASRADLFKNSVFCIMPSVKADPKAVETAVNLGRILGATPFFLDAYEYDSLTQGIEVVPGLVAAAMLRAMTKSTGWRDMLRFAGLGFAQSTASLDNPDLARLALNDKKASLRWLDAVLGELQEVRRWINESDEERFTFIVEELTIEREQWLHERRENNWIEDDSSNVSTAGIARQLMGFGFGRGDEQSKKGS
ncbi:MAG TPA: prephenate dehydrogenase/arogenate dehydrogenase family protein [Patescibacteria group bacterium]|nr:prephenate dehydrogenase/arogenate dehydrogenase family protein [Patescibacteria group bacterium]